VVAKAGLSALRIASSGFALPLLSSYQKLASSAMTATAVTPRRLRNEAALISISIPFARLRTSAVLPATSLASIGTDSTMPTT